MFLCHLLKTRPKNEAQLPFLEHHSKMQAGVKAEDYLINLIAYGPHYLVSVFLRSILQTWVYLGIIPDLHQRPLPSWTESNLAMKRRLWLSGVIFCLPGLQHREGKRGDVLLCSVFPSPPMWLLYHELETKRLNSSTFYWHLSIWFGLVVFFRPSLVLHTYKCKKASPGDTVRWLSILPPICHVNLNHARENLI